MKKAYNQTWIENLRIQEKASYWLSKNLITEDQLSKIKTDFPEQFYRPGIFVKLGLFFFAIIACSFFVGFVSLFFIDSENFVLISLICLLGFVIALEYLIKNRNLFHSGVDNALLYSSIGAALVPVFMLFENLDVWQYCILLLIILSAAVIRYADFLTTIGWFAVIFTLTANLLMKFPVGRALLPFAVMLLSITLYFGVKKVRDIYYHDCRKLLEAASLITFYLGGNYMVVREGNAVLNESNLPMSPQIAFAPLFCLFTLIIPLSYVVLGVRKNDRILFIVGLLSTAFSVYTLRFYFGILTPAQEITAAGAIMIIAASVLIKYLHTPKFGITDEPDHKRRFANLEALIVAKNLGQQPQQPDIEFGGGNFGGGGAGEAY